MRQGLLGLCLDSLRFKLFLEGASGDVGIKNPGVGVDSTHITAALCPGVFSVPHSLSTLSVWTCPPLALLPCPL